MPTWFVSPWRTASGMLSIYSQEKIKSTRWKFSPWTPSTTKSNSLHSIAIPNSSDTSRQTASFSVSSASWPPPGIIYHSSPASLILIAAIFPSLMISAFAEFRILPIIFSSVMLKRKTGHPFVYTNVSKLVSSFGAGNRTWTCMKLALTRTWI